VLARGIVGDVKGEIVVASRLCKQPFALASGACLEDPEVRVRVVAARVEQETVSVHAAP
jgi:nitrite reductase (NADH) small subunit